MTNKTGAATLESSVRAVPSIAGTVTHLNTAAEGYIEIQDLSVSYGKRVVVEGVNLRVPRNSVTALIGPSGCGKSSLLHCLNRHLLKPVLHYHSLLHQFLIDLNLLF